MSIPFRVFEMGDRPPILTRARQNAPQAAMVLGELLANVEVADAAAVVLDWSNELGQLPDDAVRPVLYLQLHKWMPDGGDNNHLTVESRIYVDEVFGGDDFMTNSLLRDIVNELANKATEALANRPTE